MLMSINPQNKFHSCLTRLPTNRRRAVKSHHLHFRSNQTIAPSQSNFESTKDVHSARCSHAATAAVNCNKRDELE